MWEPVVCVALILALYGAKVGALLGVRSKWWASLVFAIALCFCVLVTWELADWNPPYTTTAGRYVGTPIHMFAVPCVSFFVDLSRRSAGKSCNWFWRVPLELFVGVPLWMFVWSFFEFALGWVRI
jgi:hypothetical protein